MNLDKDPLFRDPRFAQLYDSLCGWDRRDDFDFCMRLAAAASSVLDLGCGTGTLAAALAPDRRVTGVDPAAAMLAVARERRGGERVRWIEADARDVRLDEEFDLVLLTGHAFQVFLNEADRLAVLRTIAAHLAPEGRFLFDSRNPAVRAWLDWVPDRSREHFDHDTLGRIEKWNDARHDPATGVVTYMTYYRFDHSGDTLIAESRIAFPSKSELETELQEARLSVDHWYGDWFGADWTDGSREIIPLGRLAQTSSTGSVA